MDTSQNTDRWIPCPGDRVVFISRDCPEQCQALHFATIMDLDSWGNALITPPVGTCVLGEYYLYLNPSQNKFRLHPCGTMAQGEYPVSYVPLNQLVYTGKMGNSLEWCNMGMHPVLPPVDMPSVDPECIDENMASDMLSWGMVGIIKD